MDFEFRIYFRVDKSKIIYPLNRLAMDQKSNLNGGGERGYRWRGHPWKRDTFYFKVVEGSDDPGFNGYVECRLESARKPNRELIDIMGNLFRVLKFRGLSRRIYYLPQGRTKTGRIRGVKIKIGIGKLEEMRYMGFSVFIPYEIRSIDMIRTLKGLGFNTGHSGLRIGDYVANRDNSEICAGLFPKEYSTNHYDYYMNEWPEGWESLKPLLIEDKTMGLVELFNVPRYKSNENYIQRAIEFKTPSQAFVEMVERVIDALGVDKFAYRDAEKKLHVIDIETLKGMVPS